MDTKQSASDTFWSRLLGIGPGMDSEGAEVNGSRSERSRFKNNLSALIQDLILMGDLQFQLLSLDLKQFLSGAKPALLQACVAGLMILGSLPVFLFGLTGLLQNQLGISAESSQLTVAGLILLLGAGIIRNSMMRIRDVSRTLKRSQEEFVNNIQWIRETFHQEQ